MALVVGGLLNLGMYFFSDRLVLRMYGARRSRAEAPDLVDRLRQRAGLPMPVVAIAEQDHPNVFATGRDPHLAVVAVTSGPVNRLPREEVEAVIAPATVLRRLDDLSRRIPMEVVPVAAPLAQVNPLAAHGGGIATLFSTHTPTERRVEALLARSRAG